MNYKQQI